jgi:acyl carrier protein
MTSREEIRAHILAFVNGALDVSDDFDLRIDGDMDSLRFIQLIADLEARTGKSIELVDIAPEQLTNLGALSRHIAAEIAEPQDARSPAIRPLLDGE